MNDEIPGGADPVWQPGHLELACGKIHTEEFAHE